MLRMSQHTTASSSPSPAAPEDRCLSAPMRNGMLSLGGARSRLRHCHSSSARPFVAGRASALLLLARPHPASCVPLYVSLRISSEVPQNVLCLRRAQRDVVADVVRWMRACCHAAAVTPLAAPCDPPHSTQPAAR